MDSMRPSGEYTKSACVTSVSHIAMDVPSGDQEASARSIVATWKRDASVQVAHDMTEM